MERVRFGSQTLLRGLDVVEVVAEGEIPLAALAERLGLTRSTVHRLASTLVERRYLTFAPRRGYGLGPKLIELGFMVRDKLDLPALAAPYLEKLAKESSDTAQLGILDRGRVLNLDKVPGARRVSINARVGEAQPLTTTGLGKALLLDHDETNWKRLYAGEKGEGSNRPSLKAWLEGMRRHAGNGYAIDDAESEAHIRSLGAPVRNAEGQIVAAISLSGACADMSDARLRTLSKEVLATAQRISRDLGWTPAPKSKSTKGKKAARKKA